MKSYYLTFLALVMSLNFFAQNYELVIPNKAYHYLRNYENHDVLLTVKLDSISHELGVTNLYHYLQINKNLGTDSLYNFLHYSASSECLERKSWFSASVRFDSVNPALYKFENQYNELLNFKTDAVLNEEWVFFSNSDVLIKATVTGLSTQNILGVADSVKTISLSAFFLDQTQNSTHIFNNKQILLSKNHGLIKTYAFFTFPEDSVEINLVGYEAQGAIPLSEPDFHQFDEGDYLVYINHMVQKEFIKINAVNNLTDTIEYIADYLNKTIPSGVVDSFSHTFQLKIPISNSKMFLTGSFDKFDNEDKSYFYVNYFEAGNQKIKGFNPYESPENYCFDVISNHNFHLIYQKQVGLIERIESWTETYYDNWGGEYTYDFENGKRLLYYQSINNDEIGNYATPYDASLSLRNVSSSNKSCSGDFEIMYLDSIWATSLEWNLGDGTNSFDASFSHSYLAIGSYNVSIALSSVFGDTVLNFNSAFNVGQPSTEENKTGFYEDVSCNEKLFRLTNELSDSCTWTFPDGITFSGDSVLYIFETVGNSDVILKKYFEFCETTDSILVNIYSLNSPIAPQFPVYGYIMDHSFNHFSFDDVVFPFYYNPNIYNQVSNLKYGCFQFHSCKEKVVRIRVSLIGVVYDGFGPSYEYDASFSLWIDYNNDGVFSAIEKVIHHQGNYFNSTIGINGEYDIVVSETAVLNTPLRMRLVSSFDPNSQNGADFSVVVTDKEEAVIYNEDGILKAQNLNSFYTDYQWINCSTNEIINGETIASFQPLSYGSYAAILSNSECSDTSNCIEIMGFASQTDHKNNNFLIQPNPTKDYITIHLSNEINREFELVDLLGKVVLNKKNIISNKEVIDLTSIPMGLYLLNIYEGNKIVNTQKVIKR